MVREGEPRRRYTGGARSGPVEAGADLGGERARITDRMEAHEALGKVGHVQHLAQHRQIGRDGRHARHQRLDAGQTEALPDGGEEIDIGSRDERPQCPARHVADEMHPVAHAQRLGPLDQRPA